MKKKFILLTSVFPLLFVACQSASNADGNSKDTLGSPVVSDQIVSYQLASNYFIKNTVKEEIPNRIDNQLDFDKYFGMATTMGENGKPTPIDFSKQYVIVVDYHDTGEKIELEVVNLEKNRDELILTYQVINGGQSSFETNPFLLVIVDKNITGEVVLQLAL